MAAGARWGTRPARPGVVVPGAAPPADPPASWPPAGLTDSEKLDLLMAHIGPPRPDILPENATLTELILGLYGLQEN